LTLVLAAVAAAPAHAASPPKAPHISFRFYRVTAVTGTERVDFAGDAATCQADGVCGISGTETYAPAVGKQSLADYVSAGSLLQEGQNPFGLCDGETEALLAQSLKHLPMALASTEPERAVREIEAVPPALLAGARAQTFIRLINAGAYEAAGRLAPAISRRIQEGGEVDAETLDCLYCLGLLALHQKRPGEAAERFERVHELAGERAESLWSARLHEGLRLAQADLMRRG
ncbi:MAG TPA: hypothetical protein VLR69_02185, partial [Thermoanaerobaculia bacterium]|nr:hypothetical protein [Thermoanaerobaculia bacterium]